MNVRFYDCREGMGYVNPIPAVNSSFISEDGSVYEKDSEGSESLWGRIVEAQIKDNVLLIGII